jgi:phosphonopyruvate decarboxylase
MAPEAALDVVRRTRSADDVVVTTMGSARDWMLGDVAPLDMVFVPSAMGHATSLGLGIALAQPRRRVFVCNGDGSMLMNLGSLVTIAASGAENLLVVIFDNGVYEVTGHQPTPRGPAGVDFAAIARGAGIASAHHFTAIDEMEAEFSRIAKEPGPHFVSLDVATVARPGPRSPGKAWDRARVFMDALSSGS